MTKPALIFDLDATLIDTPRFKADLRNQAKILGIGKSKYGQAYQLTTAQEPLNLAGLANQLFPGRGRASHNSRKVFHCLALELLGVPRYYNYPGLSSFLNRLRRSYTLVILTYGNRDLQKRKLAQSGIVQYFSKIIITDQYKIHSLRRLKSRYKFLLVIDNYRPVIADAMKLKLSVILVPQRKSDQYMPNLLSSINRYFN